MPVQDQALRKERPPPYSHPTHTHLHEVEAGQECHAVLGSPGLLLGGDHGPRAGAGVPLGCASALLWGSSVTSSSQPPRGGAGQPPGSPRLPPIAAHRGEAAGTWGLAPPGPPHRSSPQGEPDKGFPARPRGPPAPRGGVRPSQGAVTTGGAEGRLS